MYLGGKYVGEENLVYVIPPYEYLARMIPSVSQSALQFALKSWPCFLGVDDLGGCLPD